MPLLIILDVALVLWVARLASATEHTWMHDLLAPEIDRGTLTADEVNKYAALESREVLLAKAAGMMKATMGKAAATIDALREKLETAEAA